MGTKTMGKTMGTDLVVLQYHQVRPRGFRPRGVFPRGFYVY